MAMKKQREGEEGQHLPVELWIQIMCLLPVRSLLVVRTLCKLFRSIIDDPDFAFLHLRSFPGNVDEAQTLVLRLETGKKMLFEVRERSKGGGFALITGDLLDPGLRKTDWRILTGSLDGLVLLTPKYGTEAAMLWNPSMRKCRRLHLPDPLSSSSATGFRLSGLAYDSSGKDYKVLYVSYAADFYTPDQLDGQLRAMGVWVYGVKTDSWTSVDLEKSGLLTIRARARDPWCLFLEGGLFWIEGWYDMNKEYCHRMVRFDVGAHKFQYHTNLPYAPPPERNKRMESKLVTLDGGSSLGLCAVEADYRVSVWALEADDDAATSWVKRCVIHQCAVQSLNYGKFVRVTKNGELSWRYSTSIHTRTLQVFSYNIETHECHKIEIIPLSNVIYDGDHCAHFESLLML